MAWPALIAAAGAALSGGLSAFGQSSTNKTNLSIAREQREFDERMWNQANAYNTPLQQMQRLRDAGLNPNLIYGSGSATGGTAPALKSPDMPQMQNSMQHFASSIAPAIQMYQDFRRTDAAISVQQKQAQLLEQETANKALEAVQKTYANEREAAMMPFYQSNALSESNRKRSLADLTNSQALRTEIEERLLRSTFDEDVDKARWVTRDVKQRALRGELGLELDRYLKPFGMTSSDSLWERKLLPVIENFLMKVLSKGDKKSLFELID